MIISGKIEINYNPIKLIVLVCIIMFSSRFMSGQEPPPRPLTVTVTAQGLSFGAFSQGATGGTVTIASDGSRSATGDIILLSLGFSFTTALYELVANPGTVVSQVHIKQS